MRSFIAAAAVLSPLAAFAAEPLSVDNFGERFEATRLAKLFNAYAYKGECKEGFGRTCAYSIRTTTIDVQSKLDGSGVRSVTINCAACKGEHMIVIVPAVIKTVLPKSRPKDVRSCLEASSRSIDDQSTEIVEIGDAQCLAQRRGKELTIRIAFKD